MKSLDHPELQVRSEALLLDLKHSRLPHAIVTQGKSCLMVLRFAISTCLAASELPEACSMGLDDTWHVLVLFLFLQASLAFVVKQKSLNMI